MSRVDAVMSAWCQGARQGTGEREPASKYKIDITARQRYAMGYAKKGHDLQD